MFEPIELTVINRRTLATPDDRPAFAVTNQSATGSIGSLGGSWDRIEFGDSSASLSRSLHHCEMSASALCDLSSSFLEFSRGWSQI